VASGGPYTRSTRGVSLAEQGYIHCSRAPQVQRVADAFYGGVAVVLLVIDPARLDVEVRDEDVPGQPEPFPHLYGPLALDAVVAAEPVRRGDDGRLELAPLLARHRLAGG
jgi:glutathione S-transferase